MYIRSWQDEQAEEQADIVQEKAGDDEQPYERGAVEHWTGDLLQYGVEIHNCVWLVLSVGRWLLLLMDERVLVEVMLRAPPRSLVPDLQGGRVQISRARSF